MKKIIGYGMNVLFIILIAFLTLHLLLKNAELKTIISDLERADKRWLAVGALFVFCFVAGESVIIKYMLHMFGDRTPFIRCLKYSFIGFFYSYITPSASGGQPAQMYYMKKDGIKLGYSTLIMLVIAIAYKAVLVVLGVFFYLFEHDFVMDSVGDYHWLLIVGFLLNIAYITGLVLLFFKPRWARRQAIRIVFLLVKLHILRRRKLDAYIKRINRICDTYIEGSQYIKKHLRSVFNIFVMTTVQRLFLFAVSWTVYRSYGLSGTSLLAIITLQTMIAITVEMLPLPGAAGITEACFMVMFSGVFGEELVTSGMLLSRGLTFYLLLIVGAVITFIAHFIAMRRSRKAEPLTEKLSAAGEVVNSAVKRSGSAVKSSVGTAVKKSGNAVKKSVEKVRSRSDKQ